MEVLKKLFNSIDRRYLARAYLFSALIFAYTIWFGMQINAPISGKASYHAYALAAFLVFPFAKLVWDEFVHFILGDNVFSSDVFFFTDCENYYQYIALGVWAFSCPYGIIDYLAQD